MTTQAPTATNAWRRIRILLLLLGLAYLGFYVYGLVLGVFDPLATVGFTLVAGLIIAGIIAISLRWRYGDADSDWKRDISREADQQRERRGF